MKKIFIYLRAGHQPQLYTSIKALWLCHSAEMGISLDTLNRASMNNKGEGLLYEKHQPAPWQVLRVFAKNTAEAREST
jgi:hypothetical protein